jgi:hypothetical protein
MCDKAWQFIGSENNHLAMDRPTTAIAVTREPE